LKSLRKTFQAVQQHRAGDFQVDDLMHDVVAASSSSSSTSSSCKQMQMIIILVD